MYETNYYVEGLMAEGEIGLWVGQPGNGKSLILASIMTYIDTSEPVFGKFNVTISKPYVIWINEDQPDNVVLNRFWKLCPYHTIEVRNNTGFHLVYGSLRYSLIEDIKRLVSNNYKVIVVLDSLKIISSGYDIDKSHVASDIMSRITEIRNAGATVEVIHHLSQKGNIDLKTENIEGRILNSTHILSSVDTVYFVFKVPVDKPDIFKIKIKTRRYLLDVNEPLSLLVEDSPNKESLKLTLMSENPVMPSQSARLLWRLFYDDNVQMTVRGIQLDTKDEMPVQEIRDGLHQLAIHNCILQIVAPHDRAHTVYYHRNPDFNSLKTFYASQLKG